MSVAINGTNGITYNDGSLQPSAIGKNLIINGNMQIAQRATSVTGKTTGGYYTVDRWQTTITTMGTWSQSQSTDTPSGQGFANSLKMDCTTADASPAAGDHLLVNQKFEGLNLQNLAKGTSEAKSITVSFWVKSSKTGTYILEVDDRDNTRAISQSYTINSANTWEKKTLTYAGDTTGALDNNNAVSLFLTWWLGAGSNYTSGTLATSWAARTSANRVVGQVNLADSTSNDWYITGVQFEVGTTATPFEHLQYGQQLALCQRYFEKSAQQATPILTASDATFTVTNIYNNIANGNYYATVPFVVTKRASPTVVLYPYTTPTNTARWSNDGGTDYAANSAATPNGPKEFGFSVANSSGGTLTAGSQKLIIGGWYASAEL